MVPDESAMERYCLEVPPQAHTLAKRFWPGPLTIVLKAREEIPAIVRAGGKTVGLRCPDHALTLALLRECCLPLAAPSANPSGAESPKTAQQVLDYFDGKIDAVIDGGPCGIGRESTLIDMSAAPYRILREGALSKAEIAQALAENLTVIGITGPSGVGKTTSLRELETLGALVLDCDAVYHEMLQNDDALLSALGEAFPGTVRSGTLDRKSLGKIVFSDPEKLALLNRISHTYIGLEIEKRLRDFAMKGGTLAAIDAVELISAGLDKRCTAVLGILSDRKTRLDRIVARDGITQEEAEARIMAQKPDSYYETHCTHILFNNADSDRFAADCRALFKEIINHG